MNANPDIRWPLEDVDRVISAALREDRVDADGATQALFGDVDSSTRARARITAVAAGVFCGGRGAVRAFELTEPNARIEVVRCSDDGAAVEAGDSVLVVEGPVGPLLAGERTALNWLGRLGGIATQTRRWVQLAGKVDVLDTRKTLPGWRRFDKLAVAIGGGINHRMDLADFPMVKENHRDLFRQKFIKDGGVDREIAEIVSRVRSSDATRGRPLEIEVEDYASFAACLRHGVDLILIDNQRPTDIRDWIARASADATVPGEASDWTSRLEASGGITAESIAAYADCGVKRVSIGALTHSVMALDLSLHVEWVAR